MPGQLLHGDDIDSRIEQIRTKGTAEIVGTERLQPRLARSLLQDPQHRLGCQNRLSRSQSRSLGQVGSRPRRAVRTLARRIGGEALDGSGEAGTRSRDRLGRNDGHRCHYRYRRRSPVSGWLPRRALNCDDVGTDDE